MSEQTNGEAILVKVRKLLAKAEDEACTPAEAEAFTAKAAELIAKYGIDAALLADTEPETDRVGDRVIVLDAPYALDKACLLFSVAGPLRCRCVRRTRYPYGRKELSVHLFGFGADLGVLVAGGKGGTSAKRPLSSVPRSPTSRCRSRRRWWPSSGSTSAATPPVPMPTCNP